MTTIRDIADTYGLTMIDAAEPLKVMIKPCDVAGSKAQNQTDCAIARAVKRQYRAKNVYVLRSTVWVDDGDHLVRYALPQSLQKEIVSFDRNRDFRPGEYQITPRKTDADAHAAAQRRYYEKKKQAEAPQTPTGRRLKSAPAKAAPAKRSPPQRRKTPAIRPKHKTEGIRSPDLDQY